MRKNTYNFIKLSIIASLSVIGIMFAGDNVLADSASTDSQTVSSLQKEDINSWMPDKNLQDTVAKSLGKTVSDLTKSDMPSLLTVNFESFPKDTEVNLTGLELATNLQSLFTTNIIATNIPEISIAQNGTLFTRPNVLKHVTPKGKFSNVHIGNYDAYLPASDLLGVGDDIANWQTSDLTIYTTQMTDFSQLRIPSNVLENSYVTIITDAQSVITPILIKDNNSNVLYSDENVKDISGNLLLSSLSNAAYLFYLTAFDKNGDPTYLTEDTDYSYTEKGIQFKNLPPNTDYIETQGLLPALLSLTKNANISVNYGASFKIPVKYMYSAKNITVKYIDTKGNTIPGSKDEILTGYIGDSFKSEQKSFEGYSFVNVEGQAEGIFSDQPQTIKYIYSKNPIKAKNVVVRYVDSKGNKIHDDNLIVGNIGDNYDASSASYKVAINGYTLDEEKLPLNIKGTLTNLEQVVVYVYNKDNSQTTPSSSKPSNTTSNQGSTSKLNTISLNHNSNSQGKVLPQTGENNKLSNILLSIGIFSLFSLSLLQIVRLRRRN
ncbi:hypothetical protein EFN92_08600 [Lactococcus lactis]|uniref:MucBP domain-containing protein n=1 Tax=Lactococcus lactis TaxID=1358 RepID=UPI0021A64A89|nr:MucBP domain-containing protein [Lactococcus lactis]MCT3092699.1 hypothetical protein [Lactococcus lactis]